MTDLSELERRFLSVSTLTTESVLALVENIWFTKYQEMTPLMKRIKSHRLHAADIRPEVVSTHHSEYETEQDLFHQLESRINETKRYFSDLRWRFGEAVKNSRVDHNSPDYQNMLSTLYGRFCVIDGDMERYLDKFSHEPPADGLKFKRAVGHYLQATRVSPDDGKALNQLAAVAIEYSRVLLSVALLFKTVNCKIPFPLATETLTKFLTHLPDSPDSFSDAPDSARDVLADLLGIIAHHVTGDSREPLDDLHRRFLNAVGNLPDSEPVYLTECALKEIKWDVLSVVLITIVLSQSGHASGTLQQIMKVLIGRALTNRDTLALAASLPYIQSLSDPDQFLRPIHRVTETAFVRPHFTASTAAQRLPFDELIGLSKLEATDAVNESETAAARLCAACGIPWGTLPVAPPLPMTPQSIPSNSPQSVRTSVEESGWKPLVVIDGANVAIKAGEATRSFSVKGIVTAVNYWQSRGHEVVVVVSEKHAKRGEARDPSSYLRGFENRVKGNLDAIFDLLPSSQICSIPAQNHDDSYMIQVALQEDGIIVSNDMYRDWAENRKNPTRAKKWSRSHVVAFSFVREIYIPDPNFKVPPKWLENEPID
jgi:hypothetical protein